MQRDFEIYANHRLKSKLTGFVIYVSSIIETRIFMGHELRKDREEVPFKTLEICIWFDYQSDLGR